MNVANVVAIQTNTMMAVKPIFRQIGLPVFQNRVYLTQSSAKLAPTGNVELVQCPQTGLIHNHLFDPALLTYDEDYQNEQAHSPSFRKHLERVLGVLRRNMDFQRPGIEIGCGKGYFLEMLSSAGANITGYDPAYEGTNARIVKDYFGDGYSSESPSYVVLRHVLEHIPAPWPFLARLASQCNVDTKIYIEVPCFEWISENNAFYDVFYEHVNYFTLEVLSSAFGRVLDSGKLFGGQYLYVVANLSSFRVPSTYNGRVYAPLPMDLYFDSLLARMQSNPRIYIWGAGAKGITFSNMLVRRGFPVAAIIDINPAKQGKFAGLSAIPIEAPERALMDIDGADLFVMNPVYLEEIKSMVGDRALNWISVA
jgi:hypothetical protein